jgi:hypothetical protein
MGILARFAALISRRGDTGSPACFHSRRSEATYGFATITGAMPNCDGVAHREYLIRRAASLRNWNRCREASLTEAELRGLTRRILEEGNER